MKMTQKYLIFRKTSMSLLFLPIFLSLFLTGCLTDLNPVFKMIDLTADPKSGDLPSQVAEEPYLMITANCPCVEGTNATVTMQLSAPSTKVIEISYSTENLETLNFLSRAEAVSDYLEKRGTVIFNAGETSKSFSISTIQNISLEHNEKFKVKFFDLKNIDLTQREIELEVTDDDVAIFGADYSEVVNQSGRTSAPEYIFRTTKNVYVDKNTGSDLNSGESETSAFRSIQKAVDISTPGTRILVKDGVYLEQVRFPRSGEESAPIVLSAMSGHSPVISGAKIATNVIENNDSPTESGGLFSSGFEEGTLSNSFSINRPTLDTDISVASDSTIAAHGSGFLLASFSAPSSTNKGSHVRLDTSNTSPKLGVRFYFALNSGFAFFEGNKRMEVASVEDATTKFMRLYLVKDGTNNRYFFSLYDSANTLLYSSQADQHFVVPGGAYLSVEMYYKSDEPSTPLSLIINHNAATLASQASQVGRIPSRVRLGAIHTSSTAVTYPTAGSKIYIDSFKVVSGQVGPFNPIWPPQRTIVDGFESGLSGWTNTLGSGNSVSSVSTEKRYGSNSVKLSFAGSDAQNSMKKTILETDDVFVRTFFKLEDFDLNIANSSNSTNTSMWKILSLYQGNTERVRVSLVKTTQGFKLDARVLTPQVSSISNFYLGYPQEIKTDSWQQLELRFKGNDASTGGVELWLDGKSIAGNYHRTPNPDVYYGLNTSGMLIDSIQIGETDAANAVRPVAGSKVFFDDISIGSGAPVGLVPNGSPIKIFKFEFASSDYEGMENTSPDMVILSGVGHERGTALHQVPSKNVLGPGTFTVVGNRVYFRTPGDQTVSNMSIEYGVRDAGVEIEGHSHIVVQGFNIRGSNHGNKGAIYLTEGAQHNKIIDNFIQSNAGAGIRFEAKVDHGTNEVVRQSSSNLIAKNHFKDNLLAFGSGLRINNSGSLTIEHNIFESDIGTNISVECEYRNTCKGYKIRRNQFLSAGESNLYLAKYLGESEVYSNLIRSPRSSSYHTMKYGVRGSSGGSGVHIARDSRGVRVFNNLIFDVDTGGVTLRAKVSGNIVFNNTISHVARKGSGVGIDLAKDDNEAALPDSDGNGILDGQEDVENNYIFNNILANAPGSNRCLDLEGYDSDTASAPISYDISNRSNYNVFYRCGRATLFGSQTFTDATFQNYVNSTLSLGGLKRDENSIVIPTSQNIFSDPENFDFSYINPISGACRIGQNCPWAP